MAKITLLKNEQMITSLGAEVPDIKVKYQETESGLFVRKYHATLSYASSHPNWGPTIEDQWDITKIIDNPRTSYEWETIIPRFITLTRTAYENLEVRCPELEQPTRWDLEEKLYRATSIVTAQPRIFQFFASNIKNVRIDEATQKVRNAERNAEEAQKAEQRRVDEIARAERRKIEEANEAKQRQEEQQKRQISQGVLNAAITHETEIRYRYATQITTTNHFDYSLTRADIRSIVCALNDSNDNMTMRPVGSNAKNGEWAALIKNVVGEPFYKRLFSIEEDMDHFYLRALEHLKATVQKNQVDPANITKEMYEQALRSVISLEDVTELFTRDRIVQTEMLTRVEKKLAESPTNFQKAYDALITNLSIKGGLYTCPTYNLPPFVLEPSCCESNEQYQLSIQIAQRRFEEFITINRPHLRWPITKGDMDKDELMYVGSEVNELLHPGSVGRRHGWDTWNGQIHVKFGFLSGRRPHNDEYDITWIKTAHLQPVRPLDKLETTPSELATKVVKQASEMAIKTATDASIVTVQNQLRTFHPRLAEEQQFTTQFAEKMLERFNAIFANGNGNGNHQPEGATIPASETQ